MGGEGGKRETVMGLDLWLMQWVNVTCSNWVFDMMLPWITLLGSKVMGFLFALILFVSTKSGRTTVWYMIILGINAIIFEGLKYVVKRSRPFAIHEVILRISPAEASGMDPSFPSAHSAVAFIIATTLSYQYGKYRLLWYGIAGLVGLSRIYLGVHYPSDVIIGAALGYGVTKAIILTSKGGDHKKRAGTLGNRHYL